MGRGPRSKPTEASLRLTTPEAGHANMGSMSEEQKQGDNRSRPTTDEFREFVRSGWAPRSEATPERSPAADYAAARREALSARFPGERLVIPAGGLKVRSNEIGRASCRERV